MHTKTLTSREAAKIKRLLINGGYHQHQIAALYGVNQGRISEIKNGKRYSEVLPSK